MTHPTISQKAVKAALNAYNKAIAAHVRTTSDRSCTLDDIRMVGLKAALTAALAVDGLVLVNQDALDWLFGEAPDRDGKWFGECEGAMKPVAGKHTRAYWWRSKFRAMLSAAPTGTEG